MFCSEKRVEFVGSDFESAANWMQRERSLVLEGSKQTEATNEGKKKYSRRVCSESGSDFIDKDSKDLECVEQEDLVCINSSSFFLVFSNQFFSFFSLFFQINSSSFLWIISQIPENCIEYSAFHRAKF